MSGDRSVMAEYLPFLRARAPVVLTRRHPHLGPAICARRFELSGSDCGRLAYYTNAHDSTHASEQPLILLHGVHASASSFDMTHLFEQFRSARPVYALDLPGFGCSERTHRSYTPELYVRAIAQLVELATRGSAPADLVAVGLTAEFAAQVAVDEPGRVHSLTLISPTGFAVKREQGRLERIARHGKRLLPVQLADRLGLSPLVHRLRVSHHALRRQFGNVIAKGAALPDELLRYSYATSHQPGAERAVMAYMAGALYPQGNPQSVYTRVHCPTLIVRGEQDTQRYGSLDIFVKWREFFHAEQVADASLLYEDSAQHVADRMRSFWERVREEEELELAHPWHVDVDNAHDVAAVSSY